MVNDSLQRVLSILFHPQAVAPFPLSVMANTVMNTTTTTHEKAGAGMSVAGISGVTGMLSGMEKKGVGTEGMEVAMQSSESVRPCDRAFRQSF